MARILIADERADVREVAALLLRSRGHTVEVAEGGTEALAALAGFVPDIVVADGDSASAPASDVRAEMRSRLGFESVPVVVLTDGRPATAACDGPPPSGTLRVDRLTDLPGVIEAVAGGRSRARRSSPGASPGTPDGASHTAARPALGHRLTGSIAVVMPDSTLSRQTVTGLREAGHAVHTAHTTREGLALLDSLRPDVLVIDYAMPSVDGVRLARETRARDETSLIPVVFFTGDSRDAYLSSLIQPPAPLFVLSTAGVEELLAVVRTALSTPPPHG